MTGELSPDPTETRGARWVGPEELETLVATTGKLGIDAITEDTFCEIPGLEPIWVELLHLTGIRPATPTERRIARRLYTTPPAHYWDDVNQREVPVEDYALRCA